MATTLTHQTPTLTATGYLTDSTPTPATQTPTVTEYLTVRTLTLTVTAYQTTKNKEYLAQGSLLQMNLQTLQVLAMAATNLGPIRLTTLKVRFKLLKQHREFRAQAPDLLTP